MRRRRILTDDARHVGSIVQKVRETALPLHDAADLDPLLNRIGDSRLVLLGEASHGTSEYYNWRRVISQRLIEERGFHFIAVEGDWPDCYRVNRYVRGFQDSGSDAREALQVFDRWPTWMWANQEVAQLIEWLRHRNDERPESEQVGFYGLDVYSLWESMRAVLDYLQRMDGAAAAAARKAFECFEPYHEDVQDYARATIWVPTSCESEVVNMLVALRHDMEAYASDGREAAFNAEQNALVVQEAEHYYRTMARGGASSWNVRDRHMMQTLQRLLDFHGLTSKAIVWEHNTHIGDARYTDMVDSGEINVGQLVREQYGEEQSILVGFSSHRGTVIAGTEWDAPMQIMNVPPSRPGSWEDVLHQAGEQDKLLIFDGEEADPDWLLSRGHRAIGVVYHPAYEQYGNYVPTILPRRYDALLYIDQTNALHPLHLEQHAASDLPETYPSAM